MQIYVPNIHGCSLEPLRELGLGDLLDPEVSCSAIDVLQNGPDGGSGLCFFWGDEQNPGVHLDDQVWSPGKPNPAIAREAGAFWIGVNKERLPGPTDLRRSRQLPSCPVTLADGNEWEIPVAIRLPKTLTIDDSGNPSSRVQGTYEKFYRQATQFFDLIVNFRGGESLCLPRAFAFACECLALNYRINRDLVDLLELLTEENVVWLIGATFELKDLRDIAAQKKTA